MAVTFNFWPSCDPSMSVLAHFRLRRKWIETSTSDLAERVPEVGETINEMRSVVNLIHCRLFRVYCVGLMRYIVLKDISMC